MFSEDNKQEKIMDLKGSWMEISNFGVPQLSILRYCLGVLLLRTKTTTSIDRQGIYKRENAYLFWLPVRCHLFRFGLSHLSLEILKRRGTHVDLFGEWSPQIRFRWRSSPERAQLGSSLRLLRPEDSTPEGADECSVCSWKSRDYTALTQCCARCYRCVPVVVSR